MLKFTIISFSSAFLQCVDFLRMCKGTYRKSGQKIVQARMVTSFFPLLTLPTLLPHRPCEAVMSYLSI